MKIESVTIEVEYGNELNNTEAILQSFYDLIFNEIDKELTYEKH